MPVEWEKLTARLDPGKFTIETVLSLVGKVDLMRKVVGARR
jgi:DNA primase